ncbi:hypothetical protein DLM76_02120 [Leptospira yasudae]|nr:hypothetical protein DLM76_02120 [Leptospira yasudae]
MDIKNSEDCMNFVFRFFNVMIVSVFLIVTQTSCSSYYQLAGKDTMTAGEAIVEIDMAVLLGLLSLPTSASSSSSRSSSSSVFTLSLITSAAGITGSASDKSERYEKSKVKDCADSISSAIILTKNTDSGLIAASACKLKKLP